MAELTPMMQQYREIKEKNRDCILFFRLGDFYEMFFEDAELASKELGITLTGRDCGQEERAPMCGVPHHAVDAYIAKLVNKGYKVAICEQLEDPAAAKGIVKRDIIRIVTPGTILDSNILDEKKNNYLMCVYKKGYVYGISIADISTGTFYSSQILWGNTASKLVDEIAKYSPAEIVANSEFMNDAGTLEKIRSRFNTYISAIYDGHFDVNRAKGLLDTHFGGLAGEACGFKSGGREPALSSAGALIEYLSQTQKTRLDNIRNIEFYNIEEYMVLDASTRRNLELTETMRDRNKRGSLLWVLDRTATSMGGRMLRKWVEQPLLDIAQIRRRLDSVGELKNDYIARTGLQEHLKQVYDLERLVSKVVFGTVNCRDLIALKNSVARIPEIKKGSARFDTGLLREVHSNIDELKDVFDLLERAIVDDPPVMVKEGGIIKTGFDSEVDRLRTASTEGKNWIAALENKERERTGIRNLRVGYNKVFGYYIEVTKSYYHLVPKEYIRKQTLANCERYVTPELKEIEDAVLGAEEKLVELEYLIFTRVRETVAAEVDRIKNTAFHIAVLDVLCSLADVADRDGYVMPEVNGQDEIHICEGRHPVVEKMMPGNTFVPNDTLLDCRGNRVSIITGPNMAGKSTYMRQVALIVLMAQMGSFVPAKSAVIGAVDRIFTRVGASDDLASGQSTFMVEMTEVANILGNATKRSLLVLDEIGRGTSTFDGLSIAWAVIEFVSGEKIGARTLFATHYHELTELEGKIPGVNNYCIAVEKKGDEILFLRKIMRGGADDSYGIEVAKLAGVPDDVITRAKEILAELEDADISKKEKRLAKKAIPVEGQLDIFSCNTKIGQVIEELKNINVATMSPIDALNALYNLQKRL